MFDIVTLSGTVKNLIDKHNTTTSSYNVSKDMVKKIQKVTIGFHESKPTPNILFPSVFVEPRNKRTDFGQMGNSNKHMIDVEMDVVGVTQYGLGQINGRELCDTQNFYLSRNLEYLFRNYIQLSASSYVLKSIVPETEYDVVEYNDTYNSICRLKLLINCYSE